MNERNKYTPLMRVFSTYIMFYITLYTIISFCGRDYVFPLKARYI